MLFDVVRSIHVLSNTAFALSIAAGYFLPLPWFLTPNIVYALLIALRRAEEWVHGMGDDEVADRRAGHLWPCVVAALGGVLARAFY